MLNFQGLIKNEVGFLGVIKKKSCGISRGLEYWAWNWAIPEKNQTGGGEGGEVEDIIV